MKLVFILLTNVRRSIAPKVKYWLKTYAGLYIYLS